MGNSCSYDSVQEDRHISKLTGGSSYDSVQEVATGGASAAIGDDDVLGSGEAHGSLSNISYQVAVERGRGTPGS